MTEFEILTLCVNMLLLMVNFGLLVATILK